MMSATLDWAGAAGCCAIAAVAATPSTPRAMASRRRNGVIVTTLAKPGRRPRQTRRLGRGDALAAVHLGPDGAGGGDGLQHHLGEQRPAAVADEHAGVLEGGGAAAAARDEVDHRHRVAALGGERRPADLRGGAAIA